ncbi:efflux transporter outer membrane subunit [Pararobbsia silviterrae]|uniref:Efflux transporter outer membrane subunit n=1 Tax=Pararobbsia silviterrae TaxID=1792498 RepID=A0A494XHT3_9BURK|nr:efflux transporter outer membrane subunit [Pararobbsia silviterrae]RKP47103.1 efflux transporter outer membrane subunit [Pararobbsia silviterrae]
MTYKLHALSIPFCAALLCSCAAPPSKPDVDALVPTAWRTTAPSNDSACGTQAAGASPCAAAATPDAVTADWWRGFGSEELDAIVQRAIDGSTDIAAAIARVHEAAAQARIAGAALWPDLVANVTAQRQIGGAGDITVDNGNSYAINLAASYEIDFWGKNRALRRAAGADFDASVFDRDTVRLTTVSTAASLWLQIVALHERAAIASRNVELAQRTLALVESQTRAGAASPLDVARQRGVVASQQRSAAALRQSAHDDEATLAVLLGVPVERVIVRTNSLAQIRVRSIDAGVPSALLVRRPDIARAEAQLSAADANIAAARAAMLPSITLSPGIGFASDTVHGLFDAPLYTLAAGLTAPIFDGGRLRAQRDLAIAEREETLANYRASIVTAFGDVDKALNAIGGVDAQLDAQREVLAQAQRAETLALSRYRAGAETMLTVLDAQQTLFDAQDLWAQLKQERLQADVSLFQALGGGWQAPADGASDRDRAS